MSREGSSPKQRALISYAREGEHSVVSRKYLSISARPGAYARIEQNGQQWVRLKPQRFYLEKIRWNQPGMFVDRFYDDSSTSLR
jgi:hypothetical protein